MDHIGIPNNQVLLFTNHRMELRNWNHFGHFKGQLLFKINSHQYNEQMTSFKIDQYICTLLTGQEAWQIESNLKDLD